MGWGGKCFSIIVCFVCGTAELSGVTTDIELVASVQNEHVIVGEPIVVRIQLINKGHNDEELHLGAEGNEAFNIKVMGASNQTVCEFVGATRREGTAFIATPMIRPGENIIKTFVLDKWCQHMLPRGAYNIEAQYTDQENASLVLHGKAKVDISSANIMQTNRWLSATYEGIMGHPPSDELRVLVQEMAYCHFPQSVSYMEKLLMLPTSQIGELEMGEMVVGLGRIGSLEAARILVRVIGRESRGTWLGQISRQTAYQLYDKVKAERGQADIANELKKVIDLK